MALKKDVYETRNGLCCCDLCNKKSNRNKTHQIHTALPGWNTSIDLLAPAIDAQVRSNNKRICGDQDSSIGFAITEESG
jgi:hypothetical protein